MPLGRRAVPFSCFGVRLGSVGVGVGPPLHDAVADVCGRCGTDRFGFTKLKAEVMSPVTERRQWVRFGTSTPKRASRNCRIDVWSKRSEHTKPPRLKGETTRVGTRKP